MALRAARAGFGEQRARPVRVHHREDASIVVRVVGRHPRLFEDVKNEAAEAEKRGEQPFTWCPMRILTSIKHREKPEAEWKYKTIRILYMMRKKIHSTG